MTQYKDKSSEFPAYRLFLIGRSVAFVVLAAILLAAAVPDMNSVLFSAVCLGLTVIAFVGQMLVDTTLIHTGQFLVEDGEALYTVIGTLNLGFGRKRRIRQRHVSVYRYSCICGVKGVTLYPFGIGLKAQVYTATSNALDVGSEIFDEPGGLKRLLMEKGRKKTVLFRIEHNLLPSEEERLLKRLEKLN